MTEGKSTKLNQSVEKVFNIIELLAKNRYPTRLQDISVALDMNPSTVIRFLATLIKCGYVAQDAETSKYYLTFKINSVANMMDVKTSLREIAYPFLQSVSRIFEETVCLVVEQDMSMVYIDVVEGPKQMLRTMQRPGNMAPMHCTGAGKMFLSEYSDKRLDKLIAQKGLPRLTSKTITSKEELQRELVNIKKAGYAFDNEEYETGARCVAVPITSYDDKIIACITVSGPIFRLTDEIVFEHLDFLMDVAKKISEKIGN